MSSLVSEIVESKEEQGSLHGNHVLKAEGKGIKPEMKPGSSFTHDDDLNKLFAAINCKISAEGLSPRYVVPDALRKLKKPMIAMSPPPSTVGISEPVTLKQALRGLCISQASEMAAMKRTSKTNSPLSSDTGKLKSFCKSVKAEPDDPHPNAEESKGNILFPSRPPFSDGSTMFAQVPKKKQVNPVTPSPLSILHTESPRTPTSLWSTPSPEIQVKPLSNMKPTVMEDVLHDSHSPVLHKSTPEASKILPASWNKPKNEGGSILVNLGRKDSAQKPAKNGKLLTSPSMPFTINVSMGKKASKSSQYMVKFVPPNKGSVKKKSKQQDLSSPSSTGDHNEELDVVPTVKQLICQRCQCALNSSVAMTNTVPNSDNFGSNFKTSESIRTNDDSRLDKTEKSLEKGEISQSSQSSLGEYSSCTSVSGESSLSRPSCSNRPHMSKDVRWNAIRQVRSKHRVLGLEHFSLIKKLGCGDIGTVYLAELIGSNCLFAIKVMDIEYLERRKKTNRAETERTILKILDHPFLPTLYAHFTSDNLSCLVMEYCPGGDLHVLRQKQPDRNFSEKAARFYAAEVLLALEYLHMLGVVYRDLKPENILVREDGHIMLTDFDLSLRCTVSPTLLRSPPPFSLHHSRVDPPGCIDPLCSDPSFRVPSCFSPRFLPGGGGGRRRVKCRRSGGGGRLPQLVVEPTEARSNSFVGTHEYLAPEIIKGEGHGSAVDWWTFGVFLYELLYGKTPFRGGGNEETLGNVVAHGLRFPDAPVVSGLARDLIRGLLVKDPGRRLGSERGTAEIKRHPFFEGLNWALVRCAVPPEVPVPGPSPEEVMPDVGGQNGNLEIDMF